MCFREHQARESSAPSPETASDLAIDMTAAEPQSQKSVIHLRGVLTRCDGPDLRCSPIGLLMPLRRVTARIGTTSGSWEVLQSHEAANAKTGRQARPLALGPCSQSQ